MNIRKLLGKGLKNVPKYKESCVLYNWHDLNIGRLEFKDGIYTFYVNTANKEALSKTAFPMDLLFNGQDVLESTEMPGFMADFIPSSKRTDVNELCDIKPDDSPFVKLHKVTRIGFNMQRPWLETNEPHLYPKVGTNYVPKPFGKKGKTK